MRWEDDFKKDPGIRRVNRDIEEWKKLGEAYIQRSNKEKNFGHLMLGKSHKWFLKGQMFQFSAISQKTFSKTYPCCRLLHTAPYTPLLFQTDCYYQGSPHRWIVNIVFVLCRNTIVDSNPHKGRLLWVGCRFL